MSNRRKFCLQYSESMSREQLAIVSCPSLADWRVAKEPEEDEIPIGDVEFCETLFGKQPKIKNFYPDFLRKHLHRDVRLERGLNQWGFFTKSAESWKGVNTGIKESNYIPANYVYSSDVVYFVNEWRYYVASGWVIDAGWYDGETEDKATPTIDIDWPANFSGAVDFGELDDGRVALVEAHSPFACGWYGDDPENYVRWQIMAWDNRDYWLEKVND